MYKRMQICSFTNLKLLKKKERKGKENPDINI